MMDQKEKFTNMGISAVLHTSTRDNIPELEQKCLFDRPDSLPAIQSQKGVESGDETSQQYGLETCKTI